MRLPVRGKRVRVVDHLGASRTVAAHRGAVSLSVGQGPLYVVEPGRR